MPKTYRNPHYPYRCSPDQDGREVHHPVIVVGAGLVGLTAAVDLATRGVPTVVLDDDDTVSFGSRAICFSKRTLEIYDRLGLGERLRAKGVTWNRGKVFFKDRLVYGFDLLPEGGHAWPAFMNLQQYYPEQWLVERAEELGRSDLRWRNKVTDLRQDGDRVVLTVETPDGPYRLSCDYLLAADGARSQIRRCLDLPFNGQVFQDRFLIADVVMKADFPSERWFWFDPPFHPGQSALLHKQPDGVWRIDLQLGWDADPETEKQPERVIPRLVAMLGKDVDFELEWTSVYTFQCRRLERFTHGRVFFIGDSAHQVSPFGARGGNGGVQDADNLCWKLAAVLDGRADARLLDSYDRERIPAADENIRHSTRSTDFITPRNDAIRACRDAVLELSEHFPFARALVNSGRLSQAYRPPYSGTGPLGPGCPCPDAPLQRGNERAWLLPRLGSDFCGVYFTDAPLSDDQGDTLDGLAAAHPDLQTLVIARQGCPETAFGLDVWQDCEGCFETRYGATPGSFFLIRPDQHLAACWPALDAAAVARARAHALALEDRS
ncbi:MAG: FAD-dependent oxidoreductase [Kiloniellaceae bacterium]